MCNLENLKKPFCYTHRKHWEYMYIYHLLYVYPCWKNMAAMPWSWRNMVMIMAKHGHTMMTAWRSCFLSWSSWFIGMIMVWSLCFPCFFLENMDSLSIFSQIVAAIYNYMAHLTGVRGIYAATVASQQNLTKTTPERFRVFFGNNETASS